MKKIDTSNWKEFYLSNLFDIVGGERLTRKDMKPGNIKYIGATAFNNGVTALIGNKEHLHPAGTITVCYNGSVGQAFYQTEEFWATDDVNVLYPKFDMSPWMAYFLLPIIYSLGQKYGFVDKWTSKKMEQTKIPLPAKDEFTPDWEYMETYMKEIEKRVKTTISVLGNLI